MTKSIKPTQEEIEIIRQISKFPEKYSICIREGEVYCGQEKIGKIRRKFIPFNYQYQHKVINPARKVMRQVAACPYWKGIHKKRQIWENYSAIVDSVNYNQSFADIIGRIESTPRASKIDIERICSCR